MTANRKKFNRRIISSLAQASAEHGYMQELDLMCLVVCSVVVVAGMVVLVIL